MYIPIIRFEVEFQGLAFVGQDDAEVAEWNVPAFYLWFICHNKIVLAPSLSPPDGVLLQLPMSSDHLAPPTIWRAMSLTQHYTTANKKKSMRRIGAS